MIKVSEILQNYYAIDSTCCMVAAHDLWKFYEITTMSRTEDNDFIILKEELCEILKTCKNKKFNIPSETKYWCLSEHMPKLKVCKDDNKKDAVKRAAKAILKRTNGKLKNINFSIMQVSEKPLDYFCTMKTYEIILEEVEGNEETICYKSFVQRIK